MHIEITVRKYSEKKTSSYQTKKQRWVEEGELEKLSGRKN